MRGFQVAFQMAMYAQQWGPTMGQHPQAWYEEAHDNSWYENSHDQSWSNSAEQWHYQPATAFGETPPAAAGPPAGLPPPPPLPQPQQQPSAVPSSPPPALPKSMATTRRPPPPTYTPPPAAYTTSSSAEQSQSPPGSPDTSKPGGISLVYVDGAWILSSTVKRSRSDSDQASSDRGLKRSRSDLSETAAPERRFERPVRKISGNSDVSDSGGVKDPSAIMWVQHDLVGHIIGKDAKTVIEIQDQTGAGIRVTRENVDGKRAVYISGTPDACERARQNISGRLEHIKQRKGIVGVTGYWYHLLVAQGESPASPQPAPVAPPPSPPAMQYQAPPPSPPAMQYQAPPSPAMQYQAPASPPPAMQYRAPPSPMQYQAPAPPSPLQLHAPVLAPVPKADLFPQQPPKQPWHNAGEWTQDASGNWNPSRLPAKPAVADHDVASCTNSEDSYGQ